jgi:dTDP-4-dehydrorhamnose 3,5-epimerase
MKIVPLPLSGAFEIILEPSFDARGYFMRSYDRDTFSAHDLAHEWIQTNESWSKQNVVRGLHFQRPPFSETKLVRAISGAIYDVIVDLRGDSATFGRWHGLELSSATWNAVLVPKRCAHGFCVLSPEATVNYFVDSPYTPAAEGGVVWDDPDLAISWPLRGEALVSDKDRSLPRLKDLHPL